MSVSVKVTDRGLEALTDMKAEATKAIRQLTFETEAEVKQIIRNSAPSGATYTRRGVTHVASAPGQPPAIDTGALVGSIHSEVKGKVGRVRDGVNYGEKLEYGTPRMAARPFMMPALLRMEPRMPSIIKGELDI